jgi:hypothetical protein
VPPVILRGCDFFVFRAKVMLKTRSFGTKKSLFGNLITSSERSEGSQLSLNEAHGHMAISHFTKLTPEN